MRSFVGKSQVVWWWRDWSWPGFRRFHLGESSLSLLFRWAAWIGPLEIRRWYKLPGDAT